MEDDKERGSERQSEFPSWVAVRRKFGANNAFFSAGNLERELQAKQVSLNITEEEKTLISRLEEEEILQIHCPIVGCGVKLKLLADLEAHYAVRHTARCSVCSIVFPTTRLLNLHVSETHDSFFQAKVARNYPMYECLVEGCPGRFQSDPRRLQHLVDKHQFPRSFRFHSKKHLSQRQRQRKQQHAYKQPEPPVSQKKPGMSTLEQKKPSELLAAGETSGHLDAQMIEDGQEDQNSSFPHSAESMGAMDVDSLTAAVSRLSTVSKSVDDIPTVVSFGRRRNKGANLQPRHPQNSTGQKQGRSRQSYANNYSTNNAL